MRHILLPVLMLLGPSIAMTANQTPLACNRLALTPEVRKRHFEILGPALRAIHKQVRELPNGYEFEFPSDPATAQMISEWAAAERLCCPFFDIDLRFEHQKDGLWLRLTGGEGVKQFIRSDFARWFHQPLVP